jgi:hypothetical protein
VSAAPDRTSVETSSQRDSPGSQVCLRTEGPVLVPDPVHELECPVIFGPVHMRETLSQGAGHGTKEEAHS